MNQQWPGTPVGGQPVAPAQPAQPMRQEDPIIRRADPYKASAEARAQQDQQLQRQRFDLDAQRLQMDATLKGIQVEEAQRKIREEEEKLQKAEAAKGDAGLKLRNVIDKIDEVAIDSADNAGWFETGATGSLLKGVPGTAAYDLAENVKTIDANAAFDTLQDMRQNSPTGGALGGIAVAELDLLKSSVANLNTSQSQEQFFNNLARAKRVYLQMLERLDPEAAKSYATKKGIRFDEKGTPILYFVDGEDNREKQDPFGILSGQNGGGTPPEGGNGGGGITDGLMQGLGDIAEGAGDTIGIIGNPLNASVNAIFGTNLSTDMGRTLREGLGLPQNQNALASAINQGATAALSGAGLARLAAPALNPGAWQNALATFSRTPIADTIAGGSAGGAGQLAEQNGAGPIGQVGAALAGGVAGYTGANAAAARIAGQRVPNQVMQAADDLGVQMMPADVGGVGTRMATGGFGRTLGGIPIAEGAERSVNSAAAARTRIAGQMGNISDEAGAGQAAKRGFDQFEKSSKQRSDQLYERVSVPAESKVQLANTREALNQVTQGLQSNPELSRLWANHPRLRATLEALTPQDPAPAGRKAFAEASDRLTKAMDRYEQLRNSVVDPRELTAVRNEIDAARTAVADAEKLANSAPVGGELSWQDMQRFRSIVGEIIGQPGLSRDGSDIGALRKLYGALTSDMEVTAAQAGPRALTEFRRATQYWRGWEARIDDVFSVLLGKDGNRAGEQVFKQINAWAQSRTGDFKRIAQTIRSMPEDEAGTIRATIVQRMGMAKAAKQDATQEVFSPAEFATQWRGMSSRAKAALFPNQQHRQDLEKFAMLTDGMKRATEYQNFSNTALGANVTAQGLLAYTNPALAALSALGQFAAGKLLASPRFARAIASTYKLPEQAARRKLTEQLSVVATREPLIANDVRAVLEYINRGGNNPSATAAAAEDENK